MVFASPIWLLGLLPWAAVVIYLLPGRGVPAAVPFLGFWKGSVVVLKRPARRLPGAAISFALLALLFSILAAAEPARLVRRANYSDVSIILDRGASMALPSASGKPFRNVVSRLGNVAGKVTLVPAPGQPIECQGDAWEATANAMLPTAIPVQLEQIVGHQLLKTHGPVFVLSDQRLDLTDPRIVQIPSEPAIGTVAITAIGAVPVPHPQIMLRLENDSGLSSVPIVIQSGDVTLRREVALPVKGESADQFFDLAKLGKTIRVRIDSQQPATPWSTAQLVRQSNGIDIAVEPSVDQSVRRIADIYGKDRPASASARQVIIANHPLGNDQSGIWIGNTTGETQINGKAMVVPHEITRNVRSWPATSTTKIPEGFSTLVNIGGTAVVAVRDDSVQQVWITGDLSDWEKTSDFVVFFANVFDWMSGKDQSYASLLPAFLGTDWHAVDNDTKVRPGEWPGVYLSDAGRLVAVNAGAFPKLLAVENKTESGGVAGTVQQRISISGYVVITALGCLLMAAFAWTTNR